MDLSIAIGKSRRTKVWKNTPVSWNALAKRLSSTVRTPESFREYMSYGKEKQAEIKDRGGFVGGYLGNKLNEKGGNRFPANIEFRQILSLDIDYANIDFWSDFEAIYDVAAVIHSTHKHSKKTPRYRLIIPLNRRVSREQYEAIGRKIAFTLNIDLFDPTTFQPQRLMYWPTTSADGEYFFREQKGPALDADRVLRSYIDWENIASWPTPASEGEFITKSLKRLSDPTEKPGLIGAFCREYDIHKTIAEFLADVYEPCDQEDRYTFIEGSGSAGAIVYNGGQFLYSNHSTDPASMQLVNAFDLVRLHKFGHEDDDEKEITKKKSYKLMTDFAGADKAVVRQIGIKTNPFDDGFYNNAWLGELTVDKYGKYENTIPNFYQIIAHDQALAGRFRKNLFTNVINVSHPVPWGLTKDKSLEFEDSDLSGLQHYLESIYGIYHATKCKDALSIVFNENSFHPVRDYINSLTWDGEARVDSLLIDYLGADDNTFNRHAIRKFLVAAITRVFQPGAKFDYVLTLSGPQGILKSTFLELLAKDWHSNSFVGVEGKSAFEQLQGVWIMEIGELAGIKKADIEPVKNFITKREDRYRIPYATNPSKIARQCVFVGTTNEDKFLRDHTGDRRYWPVTLEGGYLDIYDMPVDQIWAEAKLFYDQGEKIYFDAVGEEDALAAQIEHTEIDDRAGLISSYLSIALPDKWEEMGVNERRGYIADPERYGEKPRLSVCVAEIWSELFRAETKDMGPHNTKYIHQIMSNMPGWEKAKSNLTFPIYGKQRAYVVSQNVKKFNKRKAVRR